jgi:hypothetical protein
LARIVPQDLRTLQLKYCIRPDGGSSFVERSDFVVGQAQDGTSGRLDHHEPHRVQAPHHAGNGREHIAASPEDAADDRTLEQAAHDQCTRGASTV